MVACLVWLEPGSKGSWYLGSLTIDRDEQNKELGWKIPAAAEDWVAGQGGRKVKMTVVNVRDTLLAWYARRGYTPTHDTKPFPYDDKCFGISRRRFAVCRAPKWLFGKSCSSYQVQKS